MVRAERDWKGTYRDERSVSKLHLGFTEQFRRSGRLYSSLAVYTRGVDLRDRVEGQIERE